MRPTTLFARDLHDRESRLLGILSLAAILVLTTCPFVGIEKCLPGDLIWASPDSTLRIIFWQFRVPRVLIAPAEIPVGVITSLLGGPFFLWLLLSGPSGQGFSFR